MIKIINGLEKIPDEDSLNRQLMVYYLEQYHQLAVPVRLKLAKRYLDDEQPRGASKILQPLASPDSKLQLSPSQQKMLGQLQAIAKRQIAEGVIEVQMDD